MARKKKEVSVRDDKGRFVKGVSGNPSGMPKGARQQITVLRENTELALRDYLASEENQLKAMEAIDRVFDIALSGDDGAAIRAMKLLLDRLLPQGATTTQEEVKRPSIAIQIINQTDRDTPAVTVLEGEVIHEE